MRVDSVSSAKGKIARKEMSPRAQLLLLIAAIATLGIDGLFIRNLLRERQTGDESLNWPQVEGTVSQCEFHRGAHNSPNATISYQYSVGRNSYSSDQANVAGRYIRFRPRAFVDNHPVGTKIPVYYNPNNPHVSVVVPGIDHENTACLVLFAALPAPLAVCSLYLAFRIIRRSNANNIRPSYA